MYLLYSRIDWKSTERRQDQGDQAFNWESFPFYLSVPANALSISDWRQQITATTAQSLILFLNKDPRLGFH